MPANPKNRQEFLRMQEQAMAAAREMQRRATLPIPPRQEADPFARGGMDRNQGIRNSWGMPEQPPPRPSFQQAHQHVKVSQHVQSMPQQPLHHRTPSQQARQNASYGRIRPQIHDPPPRKSNWQKPGRPQQQPHQHGPKSGNAYREEPAAAMPPLADIFSILGGLGGGAPESPPTQSAFEGIPSGDEGTPFEGVDSILMMVLLLLLRKENADQGLLLALMYIML